ncbi:MAG: hypothetical protein AAF465_14470 [Pseudomonadota bacterium]
MNKSLTLIAAGVTALTLMSQPAQASTQDDLKKCRAALSAQGLYDQDQHSLKFSHRKGNTRKRTMFMTLKDRDADSRQKVACQIERKDVIDVAVTP